MRNQFQSTHPMRDATLLAFLVLSQMIISIHASHAGCDGHVLSGVSDRVRISIHASHAGCDYLRKYTGVPYLIISIHASHAGCDWDALTHIGYAYKFQSTHPMRDATCRQRSISSMLMDFNPRIPCGMRPNLMGYGNWVKLFQSTHPMRDATIGRYSGQS